MPGVESRDFESPDETRTPDKTQVDVVRGLDDSRTDDFRAGVALVEMRQARRRN